MENIGLTKKPEEILQEFNDDSVVVGKQTAKFLQLVYPSYLVNEENIEDYLDPAGSDRLESITFFRITSCTAENMEDIFEDVSNQFQKLFSALYSVSIPVAYGIVSQNGITHLLLGIYKSKDVDSVISVTQGMLSGISLEPVNPVFHSGSGRKICHGILSGIPSLYVNNEKQQFSLSSIMRSLNGQDYRLLFIAKPVEREHISQNISELITVRDQAFAVSKRNIARSSSFSETQTASKSMTDAKSNVGGQVGSGIGTAVGAFAGATIGGMVPVLGPLAGMGLGGAIGGGLGTVIGNLVGQGKSHSDTFSESITEAIADGKTVSGDIQNGFALELMKYADSAIERLKAGQNNGMWQTAIVFSASNIVSRNLIQACLCGELSKLDAEKLPLVAFSPNRAYDESLRIPRFLDEADPNPLCSYINSAELGLLCTVPTESVPDFELRIERKFPLIAERTTDNAVTIGHVVDANRSLQNMPFSFSELDLNKHIFVCGITGSGKSTTVKKLLMEAKKPFLVIESAKKEYRHLALETEIYTFGRPEINAPKMNPFYILPGVSPQVHIDFLKDLFIASFSFYGPMPYILEKCLHAIYLKKGWDLTLGYHPLLVNHTSAVDFFNINYIQKQYSLLSHKYLFPTMQELIDEIARYIDEELKYDGEVAGNVKTAMKVRLESLCVGTKGYSFNTYEFINLEELLQKNAVFELEGIADDSDKAFSVGLLVIFINEFRQIQKEVSGFHSPGLRHLLVIEEAHRLLKNVDTERTSETLGNPKGKAVEHFTNMIAELRSYGQGVIVAEQIPTKIAPDVIKNSSSKIIHRIVSADDQRVMANTVGISESDAIQLGFLQAGFAYCHKEGMALPTKILVSDFMLVDGEQYPLDEFVTDELLMCKNDRHENRFDRINHSMVFSLFGEQSWLKIQVLAFINTLMCETAECCKSSCCKLMNYVSTEIRRRGIQLLFAKDLYRVTSCFLKETILSMMVRGIYCMPNLPDDYFVSKLETYLYSPTNDETRWIKNMLTKMYQSDIAKYAKVNVAALILRTATQDSDIPGTIRQYFLDVCDDTIQEIEQIVKGGTNI